MKEENTESQLGGSYADRVERSRGEGRRKIFEKKQHAQETKIELSEMEQKYAALTLPLMNDEHFKHYTEFKNFHVAERFAKAFDPPPEHWFKPANNGEVLAFNKGLTIGLQVIDLELKNIWKMHMSSQARAASQKGD